MDALNAKEKAAARELADRTYPVLRDVEAVSFVLNNMFNEFFGSEMVDTPKCREHIAPKSDRAQAQTNILLDYTVRIQNAPRELDAADTEGSDAS